MRSLRSFLTAGQRPGERQVHHEGTKRTKDWGFLEFPFVRFVPSWLTLSVREERCSSWCNNALGSANGTLILNGGTLELNGFTQTQSLLSLTASSTLLYSTTTLMSFFSAAPTWTGTLNLPDFVPNSDQLYFANGLSPAQLAQINVPGWTADSVQSGYVHFTAITAVPEPATWAAGIGALTMVGAMLRRRLPRK